MTGLDHEATEAISFAAEWLADTPANRIHQPIVPMLRKRFGLSVAEAIAAIREANELRKGGAHASR